MNSDIFTEDDIIDPETKSLTPIGEALILCMIFNGIRVIKNCIFYAKEKEGKDL